jgi:hypothetical protein
MNTREIGTGLRDRSNKQMYVLLTRTITENPKNVVVVGTINLVRTIETYRQQTCEACCD